MHLSIKISNCLETSVDASQTLELSMRKCIRQQKTGQKQPSKEPKDFEKPPQR